MDMAAQGFQGNCQVSTYYNYEQYHEMEQEDLVKMQRENKEEEIDELGG
jgi:molybdopterin/thiamine biosynthesis adenylyltransferase